MNNIVLRNIYYAIQNQLLIEFNYENEGTRLIEPFCVGRANSGNYLVRGFQRQGYTQSNMPAWKLFDLKKVSNMKILTDNFNPKDRKEYNMNDKVMDIIFMQIEY